MDFGLAGKGHNIMDQEEQSICSTSVASMQEINFENEHFIFEKILSGTKELAPKGNSMETGSSNQAVTSQCTCGVYDDFQKISNENMFINQSSLELVDQPRADASGEVFVDLNLRVHVAKPICLVDIQSVPFLKVEVSFGGRHYLALVDTGASFSLMSASAALECEDEIDTTKRFNIYGIAEDGGVVSTGVVERETSMAGVQMQPNSFIVLPPGINMPAPIILGVDFLKINNIEIDASKRRLSWQNKDTRVDLYLGSDGVITDKIIKNQPCYTVNKVTIKKNSSVEVQVNWSNPYCDLRSDRCLLFEGEKSTKLSHRISAIPGIVASSETSSTILLTNVSDGDVVVKEGSCVGSVATAICLPEELEEFGPWTEETVRDRVDLTNLDVTQSQILIDLLLNCSAVLSAGDQDVGKAKLPAHHIELYDNTPIYQRPRRFPAPVAEEIAHQCKSLHELGIIEPSASPWSSPVVPIRKKDGSIRLCVDYRALNRITKPDKFPMPNLTDSIFGLHGVKYFTKLDLVRGYYQIPLNDDSKEMTAFSTPHGHWHFNRLSFGLKNAPSAFQRGMQDVLKRFPWKKVIVYVDDILIMETSFDRHISLVEKVLHTLEEHGMKIKPEKCEWCKPEVQFLGHIVSQNGISKTQEFVDKIDSFPRPENVQQLREFLGLVNFQRKFIQNCSEIQKPLSCLTGGGKKQKLKWTPEMHLAFDKLKEIIKQDIKLAFPDYHPEAHKMELWVDASHVGAGACLTQQQGEEVRIIAFSSMTFQAAQKNYSILEKELAAMRWGIKCFRAFLYGTNFVLRTDHQPLVYLHNMRLVDSRLARTLEDLSDFNFVIKYTPGKLNVAADSLSRLRPLNGVEENCGAANIKLPSGLQIDGFPVPGGGNSLFQSLHIALTKAVDDNGRLPSTNFELRQQLVGELLAHPEKYNVQLNKSLRRDLNLMRCDHQLPCLEVLLAASALYEVNVNVFFWDDHPVLYQVPLKSGQLPETVIHLQCLGGIHFNPLVEIKSGRTQEVTPSCVITTLLPIPKTCGEVEEVIQMEELLLPPEFSSPLVVSSTEYNQPMLQVELSGNGFSAVLDTGAEISLVNQRVLEKLNICSIGKNGPPVNIVGLTGKIEPILGFVHLQLAVGDAKLLLHHFAVVFEDVIAPDFLLGIEFIAVNQISISVANGYCKLNANDETIVHFCDYRSSSQFVGCVEVINAAVNKISIGPPSDNLLFDLSWDGGEVTSLSALFQEDVIFRMQAHDNRLKKLRNCLNNRQSTRKWPKSLKSFARYCRNLKIMDEIIVYQAEDRVVPVLSFTMIVEILLVIHHNLTHVGRDKMIAMVRGLVWHPDIHMVSSDVCNTCPQCQLKRIRPLNVIPPTWKISSTAPFELMAADLVEFGRSSTGHIGCLMVVDHHSKWLSAVPIKDKKSSTVASALEHQVLPFLPRLP